MNRNSLEQLRSLIEHTRFDRTLSGIQGWLSHQERVALYSLARYVTGPILEIGSWVGLSTACIAYGIRDSDQPQVFVTAELNPRADNYRRVGDDVGFFLPGDQIPRGICHPKVYAKHVAPVLSKSGRAIGELRRNLIRLGLMDIVTIVESEFTRAPDLDYQFIFCDATHSPYEIMMTAQGLGQFLSPGTVLACHDTNSINEDCLREHIPFAASFQIDSLFVGQVANGYTSAQSTGGRTRSLPRPAVAGGNGQPAVPTVSVILPTYNRAHVVGRAVLSVLHQTYQDFELIVVDDASTDSTQNVLACLQDDRTRIIQHRNNRGAAAARNVGIEASRGQYVAFQDSDDEWLPEKLQKQVAMLSAAPDEVGVVYCGFQRIEGNRIRTHPSWAARWASKIPSHTRRLTGNVHDSLKRGNFVTTQAAMIRRTCFETAGLFDERLPLLEDWELWLRVSQHCQFVYLDEPLVFVYLSPDSLSTSPMDCIQRAYELILEKHDHGPEDDDLRAQYFHAMGHSACVRGDLRQGQRYLFRALRTSPANTWYWMAALLSLLGQRSYECAFGKRGWGNGLKAESELQRRK